MKLIAFLAFAGTVWGSSDAATWQTCAGGFAVVAATALLSLPEEVSAGHCYSLSSESACTVPPVGGQAACAWCNGACQMSSDDCTSNSAGGDPLEERYAAQAAELEKLLAILAGGNTLTTSPGSSDAATCAMIATFGTYTLKEAQPKFNETVNECKRTSCTVISFTDCKALTALPDGLEWPASLVELYLSNNELTVLPDQAWPASLKVLALENNALTVLPDQAWPASLEVVSLEGNELTVLPDQAWPAALKYLWLNNNALMVLPGQEWPASLVKLYLNDNALTVLPDQEWPASLEVLILFNNALTVLPDQAWPASLVLLALYNNALTVLPDQEWPASLETLNLHDNALTVLPDQEWPASLEVLSLYNNKLTVLPDQAWSASLAKLGLNNNLLTVLPDQEWPVSLTDLLLNNNELTVLPGQTWPASLKALYLHNNELTVLPDQVWPASLAQLGLNNNLLTVLPNQAWPVSLTDLLLNNNQLTTLPRFPLPRNSALNLGEVVLFDLSNNNLAFDNAETFNIAFFNLAVSHLDLSNNAMTQLPDGMILPASIVDLDLSDNQLRALPSPEQVAWPQVLVNLTLSGNTWEDAGLEDAAKQQAKAGFEFEIGEVPCKSPMGSGIWRDTAYLNDANFEDCTTADLDQMSFFADPVAAIASLAMGSTTITCTFSCKLTEAGAALAAAHPAAIAAALAEVDAKYVPVWAAGIPVAVVASAGMALAAQPSPETFGILVRFFLAVFDLTTDWAFYLIDFSSSTFQERYTCNQSAPELAPDRVCETKRINGTSLPYSCTRNDYGDRLKSKCGNLADGSLNLNAANECECNLLACDISNSCTQGSAFKCGSDYNGLDAQENEICGFLSPETGSNECECYQGTCVEVQGTGETCAQPDSADNDYNALKAACLTCNIVAAILWVVQWASFAVDARAQARARKDEASCSCSCSATIEDDVKCCQKIDEGATCCQATTEHKINTATMIAVMLLEDVPQIYFLSTFVIYMQLFSEETEEFIPKSTAPLVILSFVMSALSLLVTLHELIKRLCNVSLLGPVYYVIKQRCLNPVYELIKRCCCHCCKKETRGNTHESAVTTSNAAFNGFGATISTLAQSPYGQEPN